MSALVLYRDLPGGPIKLRFCDELSRHSLCTNCNMLSMSMLKDEKEHMFCETCLYEASVTHKREVIYCAHENKEVSIFQMFEAHDLITAVRDQYVYCPNCEATVTLDQLKNHYVECQPKITCSSCDKQIETRQWSKHKDDCNKKGVGETASKGAVSKVPQPPYSISSPRPPPTAIDSKRNTGETSTSLYPVKQLQQSQKHTNDYDEVVFCGYCEKKVKQRNMQRHLTACPKALQSCVYCGDSFGKDFMKSHHVTCKLNPDNVLEQESERPGNVQSHISQPQCIQSQPRASYNAHASYQAAASEHCKDENCETDRCCCSFRIACCCITWISCCKCQFDEPAYSHDL